MIHQIVRFRRKEEVVHRSDWWSPSLPLVLPKLACDAIRKESVLRARLKFTQDAYSFRSYRTRKVYLEVNTRKVLRRTDNRERRFVRLPHRTKRLSAEYRGGNPPSIIFKRNPKRKKRP